MQGSITTCSDKLLNLANDPPSRSSLWFFIESMALDHHNIDIIHQYTKCSFWTLFLHQSKFAAMTEFCYTF